MFTTTNHRHCTRGTSGASSWTRITFWKLSSFRGELLTRKLKPESFSRWVTWVMCKQRRTFGNFREWWSSIRIVRIVRIVRRCLMITIHFVGFRHGRRDAEWLRIARVGLRIPCFSGARPALSTQHRCSCSPTPGVATCPSHVQSV